MYVSGKFICEVWRRAYCLRCADGSVINFYQMLPLHEEEMSFKIANDFDALIDRMPEDTSVVVDINRPSAV